MTKFYKDVDSLQDEVKNERAINKPSFYHPDLKDSAKKELARSKDEKVCTYKKKGYKQIRKLKERGVPDND